MVVKCINNEGLTEYLTVGKEYEVMMDKKTHWKIASDIMVEMVVMKDRFESDIEEIEAV
jgi:hypothetical protein